MHRLFDSQNNNRGGYNVGKLYYYEGSVLSIQWWVSFDRLQIYFSMRFMMMMTKSELEKNQTWQMPYTAHTNVDRLTPKSD